METRTLLAMAIALTTVAAVIAALLYVNRERFVERGSQRRSDKRRKDRLAREAAES